MAWEMPGWIGCFALLRDGRLVAALRTGLAVFDPEDGSLRSLAAAPYDQRRFCFNDGGCDRAGHFLVGPMYYPLEAEPTPTPDAGADARRTRRYGAAARRRQTRGTARARAARAAAGADLQRPRVQPGRPHALPRRHRRRRRSGPATTTRRRRGREPARVRARRARAATPAARTAPPSIATASTSARCSAPAACCASTRPASSSARMPMPARYPTMPAFGGAGPGDPLRHLGVVPGALGQGRSQPTVRAGCSRCRPRSPACRRVT